VVRFRDAVGSLRCRSYARERSTFAAWCALSVSASARGNSFQTFEVDP
jgi:hypothetical protein